MKRAIKAKKRWYLDSGYSRYMTGDIDQFFILESKNEGSVIFGDNRKERIINIGKIKITPIFIKNVLLVDKLKHNLLSISQLCDVGFNVNFKTLICIVADYNTPKNFSDLIKFALNFRKRKWKF